jgi:RimJ/RimL family protein N-acetyltransferase
MIRTERLRLYPASLEAETDAGNAASQRILQKYVFRPNGIIGEEGPHFTLNRLDAAEGTR